MKLLFIILGLINIIFGLLNIGASYIDGDILAFIIGVSMVVLGIRVMITNTNSFKWSKTVAKWFMKPTEGYKGDYKTYDEGVLHGLRMATKIVQNYEATKNISIEEYNVTLNELIHEDMPKVTNAKIALGLHTESESKEYYQEILDAVKKQRDETTL